MPTLTRSTEPMKNEHEQHKSWLERLTHFLAREPQDREQLLELLHDAKERQLLDSDALEMMEGVLNVSEMKVRDVMIPRPKMIVVDHDTRIEQALPIIIESAHSRFPVIGEDREDIIGILLAKDLLGYLNSEKHNDTHIRDLVRPAVFAPESKRLDVLLKEFRQNRNHMAIVVDEYGGVAGLVTIEDLLEQIVGDITDETDITNDEPFIESVNDDEFLVRALIPIEDFNNFFGTDYADEDYDTFGGLVLQLFSHLPKRGESTQLDRFKITVVEATNRGIQRLRITRTSDADS